MLCCVGLIGGLAVGQSLGGPWTYIAPAAGFGIGLVADMKFMHRMHANPKPPQTNHKVEGAGGPSPAALAEAPAISNTPPASGT